MKCNLKWLRFDNLQIIRGYKVRLFAFIIKPGPTIGPPFQISQNGSEKLKTFRFLIGSK